MQFENLSNLASEEEFFFEQFNCGIAFHESFASKVEERQLGVVAGTYGSFNWTCTSSGAGSTSDARTVNFLIIEEDLDKCKSEFEFARHKVGINIRIAIVRLSFCSGNMCVSSTRGGCKQ